MKKKKKLEELMEFLQLEDYYINDDEKEEREEDETENIIEYEEPIYMDSLHENTQIETMDNDFAFDSLFLYESMFPTYHDF